MPKSMRVQIDSTGHIHALEPATIVPEGHAVLTWPDSNDDDVNLPLLLSETAFADWLSPEEDEAWAYMQVDKTCDSASHNAHS